MWLQWSRVRSPSLTLVTLTGETRSPETAIMRPMRMTPAALLVALTLEGCAPFPEVSASAELAEPLPRSCVSSYLEDSGIVSDVSAYDAGTLVASATFELTTNLSSGRRYESSVSFHVLDVVTDDGPSEVSLRSRRFALFEPSEFRDSIERVLDALLKELLKRCGPRV